MANYLLLLTAICIHTLSCGILRNDFCKKNIKNNSDLQLFNATSSVVSVIVLIFISLAQHTLTVPSTYTVILSVGFGIVSAMFIILNMRALESGPLSYTNVIISCAMVIPSLAGLFMYKIIPHWSKETITFWQVIGIVLLILSFIFAVDKKQEKKAGTSIKWFLLSLGAFLFKGSTGIIQKIHQTSPEKDELGTFLILSFAITALFSFILMIYYNKGQKLPITITKNPSLKKFIAFSLLCGTGIAFGNHINMYLSGVMDSIIFFPVSNGGSLLLITLAGLIIYKEKLSKKQYVGLALGAVAILLLCNVIR